MPTWFREKIDDLQLQLLKQLELTDDKSDSVKASHDDPVGMDLLQVLGRKGEKYSRPAVELGMEVMGHGMSAQTARDTIRTFMARLYPQQLEDVDYRVPSVKMLKRWRRLLEPVCHFIALSAMDRGQSANGTFISYYLTS